MTRRKPETAPFDLWLRRSLSGTYAAALREPLPDELEALVAQFPDLPQEH